MQAADLIKKILAREKLTSEELAARTGVDPSFMSRCASGARQPGDLLCLLLATYAHGSEERAFWISKSALTGAQLRLLADVVGATEPGILAGDEHALLAWWRDPKNPMEESVKSVVEKVLEARTSAP